MDEVNEFCERCDGFCECEAGDRLRANVIRAFAVVNDQMKIIAALEAKRDRYKAACDKYSEDELIGNDGLTIAYMSGRHDARKVVRELIAERDRLAAALTKYGRHTSECNYFGSPPIKPLICTCGLYAAIAGEGEAT